MNRIEEYLEKFWRAVRAAADGDVRAPVLEQKKTPAGRRAQ